MAQRAITEAKANKVKKRDNKDIITILNNITSVVNVMGVYQHPNQRLVLDEVIGSHDCRTVRNWLIKQYKDLL